MTATLRALWGLGAKQGIAPADYTISNQNKQGLMEAKPEEIGKIYPYRKDVPFYDLQFCIHANFLSVQS